MAKKKPVLNKPPDISILISNVLKNIEAVKNGQPVNLDYLSNFQLGMAISGALAPLIKTEDAKAGFTTGIQSYFAFDLDLNKVDSKDKDPPSRSDPEDGNDLPF